MQVPFTLRVLVYLVAAFGCALGFAAAVVPHYGHHKLWFSVLLVGVLPYLVYVIATEIVPSRPLILAGLLVLAVDVMVKLVERFFGFDQYQSGAIYYVPIIATLLLLIISFFTRARSDDPSALPSAATDNTANVSQSNH